MTRTKGIRPEHVITRHYNGQRTCVLLVEYNLWPISLQQVTLKSQPWEFVSFNGLNERDKTPTEAGQCLNQIAPGEPERDMPRSQNHRKAFFLCWRIYTHHAPILLVGFVWIICLLSWHLFSSQVWSVFWAENAPNFGLVLFWVLRHRSYTHDGCGWIHDRDGLAWSVLASTSEMSPSSSMAFHARGIWHFLFSMILPFF